MGAIALYPRTEEVQPWDFAPGDVVLLNGPRFDVLSDPFMGVAGMSYSAPASRSGASACGRSKILPMSGTPPGICATRCPYCVSVTA